MPKGRRRSVALSILVAAWSAPQARGFDRFWNSFSSGNFTDTSKWVGGAVPGPGDAAIFRVFGGTPAPYTVTLPGQLIFLGPANYVNDTLRIGPNTVTLAQSQAPNLTASTYTLSTAIQIGEGTGPAVLNSSLSLLSSPTTSIGYLAGSSATLNINSGVFNVTGSGSDAELLVGDSASGTLSVNSGATMNLNGADGNAVIGNNAGISGTLNITGAGALWNNTSNNVSAPLIVGNSGSGTLNISSGGSVNNGASYIGYLQGSIGNAAVSDAGSIWTNRDIMTVGAEGTGTLTILGGGVVTCSSAGIGPSPTGAGTVTVMGANSLWSQAGDLTIGGISSFNGTSGTGVVMISAGGTVTTGGDGAVGSSGLGTVSVSGSGSKWTVAGQLSVDGQSSMALSDGGMMSANTGIVIGMVNVKSAATLNIRDYLQVSDSTIFGSNTGTINVSAGGRVNSRVSLIAAGGFGGRGRVHIDGAGSIWTTIDQVYVGLLGGGQVMVTGGGQVSSGECQVGVSPGSGGTIVVDGAGSKWNTALNIDVGVAGTGNLTVSNGGVVTVGGLLSIGPNGTVEGNSTLAASVQNGGTVAPGIASSMNPTDAFATLLVTGNYVQSSAGRMQVDLKSTSQFDRLQVKGTATLAGTLGISLAPGFSAIPGDRFTVLTSAQRNGVFDSVVSLSGGGTKLVPIYGPGDAVIYVARTEEKTWGVDASGNSSLASNWIGGAPGAVDDKVALSTVITAPRSVRVDTSFKAGSIYFDGSNSYLVQGPGGITLDVSSGNASLSVRNLHGGAAHTIAAPITLDDSTTIDVADSSSLQISQAMNAAAGVSITKTGAGALAVKNVRADGLQIGAGKVQVMPGGGAEGTSVVKTLMIGASAKFDLNNNDLLINYTGASPYTTVRGYLLAGLNTGVGGIVSTTGQNVGNAVHAVVDNVNLHRTQWNGLPIDDTTIIAKYTLRGDANLDGSVGFADLVTVAQNYGNSSGTAIWTMGDFNYDGDVGFSDLVALAQNYGGALPAGRIAGEGAEFEGAMASVPVPEPVLAWLGLLVLGSLERVRRRH